ARPRAVAGHLAGAGPLRLGRRLEKGRVLGPRRVARREGIGPAAAAARVARDGARRAATGPDRVVPRQRGGRHHVGNVLSHIESRHRAGVDRHRRGRRDIRARRGRRSRPKAGVRGGRSAVRRRENSLARQRTITRMKNGPLEFTVERSAHPVTDEQRTVIMTNPPFGQHHTDHMVSIDYTDGQGWHDARVTPYSPIELDPSATILHYAQGIFEGLKAYRWADGSIVSFRPEANAARMRTSAHRLAIPELSEATFIESLRQLIAVDGQWVPPAGGEESLYMRPFVFATEAGLGVRPAKEYRYLVIASPVGAYFPRGIK